MIKKALHKLIGTRNTRLLKQYNKVVVQINNFEPLIKSLSDDQLKAKTQEFRLRLKTESLANLLPEVFAVCREASLRTLKMRHFDVQLIGAMVLNDGKIAEMRTGEGKTLVATLAAYLNALTGNGVHVITVNDYLAKRDATDMGALYNFLGLTVGINLPDMSHIEKQHAYNCDITYGTNNEFGFDYLRDNMVFDFKDKVQKRLSFAIVDEVDSILIDEARTPLIISGPSEGSNELYTKLNKVPKLLKPQEKEDSQDGDFWVDEKAHNVLLSEMGHEKIEQILSDMGLLKVGDSLYNINNISLMHHLLASLKAHYIYHKDQHYVVQDGEVVIVDEFTGRLMSGRRWSDGLHQAVEAKEGVEIQRENLTMASITFQNYFRMYKKLSGMTGTADTEAYEFQQIYALETVVIPTNQLMVRKDYNDKIYLHLEDKYQAIIEEIKGCNIKGQPVLVGTTSVENSEILANLLMKAGLKHEVLNAKQHAREAEIIVQAGSIGAITVATNMAGRGTDIILGGNPKPLIKAIQSDSSLDEATRTKNLDEAMLKWNEQNQLVKEAGGLFIIGTERHESRRIDNQLRGRSGRQGDPGASRFYLSLEDTLLRIFGGEKMRLMMQRLGMTKGESIEHKWLSRSIESAQRKVEGHNFDIRKQLLDYDNVANDQRRVIYQQRDEILEGDHLEEITHNMIKSVINQVFDNYIPPNSMEEMWDINNLENLLKNEYLLDYPLADKLKQNTNIDPSLIKQEIIEILLNNYRSKINELSQKANLEIDNFLNNVISSDKENWNLSALDQFCKQNGFLVEQSFVEFYAQNPDITKDAILERFNTIVPNSGNMQTTSFERGILIQHIDYFWRDHLTQLEQLRQGIHLRGYAQKDPKQEYKQESFNLFSQMLDNIKKDVVKVLLTIKVQGINNISSSEEFAYSNTNNSQQVHKDPVSMLMSNAKDDPITSRNALCPCGSGQKFKRCCGKLS